MTSMDEITTWLVPIESKEWIGPVIVTENGEPTAAPWKIALVPDGQRPGSGSDFLDRSADPDGVADSFGAWAQPVELAQRGDWYIWVWVNPDATEDEEAPVLRKVARVTRT